eukprot:CAMPEP_0168349270 /NCGR_PEP_ID=MMETSP0213-20121227/20305_1 /TAXON_ID=151035 /ORGANISM="Euplotes harpa, Strain FSP1.4" /LENGTH=174 /DNA_ID=CAMNT_0008359157 /DNA_START=346 /DNA_END=870 /DNA_ORIENTATION=+
MFNASSRNCVLDGSKKPSGDAVTFTDEPTTAAESEIFTYGKRERTESERGLETVLFGNEKLLDFTVKTIRFVTTEGINQDVMQKYICINDETTGMFFVNIGYCSVEGFQRATFINLMNLAEGKKASKVYFIVCRDNKDLKEYRKSFKTLDLQRVSRKEKASFSLNNDDFLMYSR